VKATTKSESIATSFMYTKTGTAVPCVTENDYLHCLSSLGVRYSINACQLVEAASYSMAMVARYALGLSAKDAFTTVVIADTLAGQIALATLRHLVHGGADGTALFLKPISQCSEDLQHQAKSLVALGLEPIEGHTDKLAQALGQEVKRSHNVLCGIGVGAELPEPLAEILNDAFTPVHCIEIPPGLRPTTGEATKSIIFASSTLCLGVPLSGIMHAQDVTGRVYICDISLPTYPLEEAGYNYPLLFDDQPVQQLLWNISE
jgi:NAD(P)H-hydrate repair Nnr-like enzyme with NAD(P)H-hydrate epimerase domain